METTNLFHKYKYRCIFSCLPKSVNFTCFSIKKYFNGEMVSYFSTTLDNRAKLMLVIPTKLSLCTRSMKKVTEKVAKEVAKASSEAIETNRLRIEYNLLMKRFLIVDLDKLDNKKLWDIDFLNLLSKYYIISYEYSYEYAKPIPNKSKTLFKQRVLLYSKLILKDPNFDFTKDI